MNVALAAGINPKPYHIVDTSEGIQRVFNSLQFILLELVMLRELIESLLNLFEFTQVESALHQGLILLIVHLALGTWRCFTKITSRVKKNANSIFEGKINRVKLQRAVN
jgi:hypothetical protein